MSYQCQHLRVISHEEGICIYDCQGRQVQRITAGADVPSRAKKTQGIAAWAVRNFVDVFGVFDSYALSDEPHTCRNRAVSTVSKHYSESIERPLPSRNFIFVTSRLSGLSTSDYQLNTNDPPVFVSTISHQPIGLRGNLFATPQLLYKQDALHFSL